MVAENRGGEIEGRDFQLQAPSLDFGPLQNIAGEVQEMLAAAMMPSFSRWLAVGPRN
jgi:hypothetical protein